MNNTKQSGKIRTMRSQILLFCLGSILFVVVLQTLLFQNTSSKLIYSQEEEKSLSSLQNMQEEIYSFVKGVERGMISVYGQEDLLRDLKNGKEIEELRQNYYRSAYLAGTENFDSSQGVAALYFYNIEHELISTYRRTVTPKHNYPTDIYEDGTSSLAEDSRDVRKYIETDETTMYISSYYNKSRECNLIRFVLKLYKNSNIKQKIGYVVCDIDTKVLRRIMERYRVDKEMFIWMQPMQGRVITSIGDIKEEDQAWFQELTKSIENRAADQTGMLSRADRVIFQVNQERYNLGAYSFIPQSVLEQNQKNLTQNLILIGMAIIIVTVVLASVVSDTLTRPLKQLTTTTERIRAGETSLRVPIEKEDEIGQLGRSFNGMLDQIESLIAEQYETKLLLNQVKYQALQAQINPHFLYNTLETMSSIADVQNCSQVSMLCQSLAGIFRYSLDMKHPYSTVEKEIAHLRNYIYVMNVRMQGNVSYEFAIEEEVLNFALPRISIQPLVENALNHGLKNKRGRKKVTIRAERVNEQLKISVEDNGIGMDEKRLLEVQKMETKDPSEKGTSIGLSNINSRIKMLYGVSYQVQIESEKDAGTRVSFRIPEGGTDEV